MKRSTGRIRRKKAEVDVRVAEMIKSLLTQRLEIICFKIRDQFSAQVAYGF